MVIPWTGIAPFSYVAPSAGWSTESVGASTVGNGTVMIQPDRVLGVLAGVRVDGVDVELVPAAAQVHGRRPQPGRLGRDLVRIAAGGPVVDVDGRVGQRDAAEGVRGRRIVHVGDRGRRVRDRDGRRLREAQELDAEIGAEREHADGHEGQDDDERGERQALARRRQGPRHRDGRPGPPWARRARAATARAPRRRRARGRARSCAGSPWCRPSRGAPSSRRAPWRRGSAPGSWCRARRGTGRRPCARAPRRGAPAGSWRRLGPAWAHRAGRLMSSASFGPVSSSVVRRRRSRGGRPDPPQAGQHTPRVPEGRLTAFRHPQSSRSTSSVERSQLSGP